MSIQVLMPALSPTMTEGKLAKWLKSEGDYLEPGDAIAEIETDKATMEVEAVDPGFLKQILVAEDTENVPVNTPIAIMTDTDADQPTGKQVVNEQIADETYSKNINKQENTKGSGNIVQNFGETVSQTVREALRDAMAEEMRADDMVYVMGEEVAEYEGAYKVTQGLLNEFGEKRVIDTPITEHGFAGLGVGAAFGSLRPVVEFMTFNFAMQAMDQIINSAAKTLYMSGGQMGCPIVFRGPNGAASRVGAQHSQDYTSWFAHCPGLKVVAPWSAADAKGLLKSAIRDPNPVIVLENEFLYGQTFEVPTDPNVTVPIGKAKVLKEGSDVTIVAFSIMVGKALEASEQLSNEGIEAEIIDLRTIRPLDVETIIKSVKKTNRIITVEEGWPTCGIGSEISSLVCEEAFDYLDAPVKRVAGVDVPMPYAANLEKLALPQSADIVSAAKAVCYRS
ncbi:MAG: pyruvate dehydrogenase complex E1 component subunit beta [Rhodospirillaceae bacterium]|nr:pyruvate dehydrogenase complex E1 component subunit beta [Rhodospirillaceae bacterium]|tara:strand:- start:12424 stop:13773 length:1350 start_codon:yes stop_codon:yes gene_type:complete